MNGHGAVLRSETQIAIKNEKTHRHKVLQIDYYSTHMIAVCYAKMVLSLGRFTKCENINCLK